jgi:hypothetical protein
VILRVGFDEVGLHKITATCDPDNVASARVEAGVVVDTRYGSAPVGDVVTVQAKSGGVSQGTA